MTKVPQPVKLVLHMAPVAPASPEAVTSAGVASESAVEAAVGAAARSFCATSAAFLSRKASRREVRALLALRGVLAPPPEITRGWLFFTKRPCCAGQEK